jgi:hypothetical protein
MYAPQTSPGWQNWRFSKSRGDGTVPVWSAANDFEKLEGTRPSFSEHATIFNDQGIKEVLLRELVSNIPPPIKGPEALFRVTTIRGTKSVGLFDIDVSPKEVSPGGFARLTIAVDFSEQINRGEFMPSAQLMGPDGPVSLSVVETTTEDDRAASRLIFASPIVAPQKEGAWEVEVMFPGQGNHSTYFETWGSR